MLSETAANRPQAIGILPALSLSMTAAPTNLTEFASAAIESAAKRSAHGLALINHAHEQYCADHGVAVELASYKRWLWAAAREGLLQLASHDMPQLLSQADRDASVIVRGASEFRRVRC
jgi:hypothetical protein